MWQIFLSIFCLLVLTRAQQTPKDPPPQITTFLSHDLINPEQVKFRTDNAMVLPCAATGSNLKWRWQHNNTDIPEGELEFGKRRLSPDGTLTGSNLGISDSGTYQCFVKDTATNVETFSRKVKVAVTVVGEFIDTSSSTRQVDLGSPQSFPCPAHQPSYGVSFTWIGKDQIQFKRNDRRGIAPNGDLFIMYVLPEDVLEINGLEGIKCTMSGANTFYSGGSLTLTTPQGQTDPGTNSGPSWSVRPGNTEIAVEGRNKTLYCLALGRPAPEITWKKNGVQLTHGGEFDIPQAFEGRLLNIIQVRKDLHEDTYSCEAENTENTGNPIVHNINLIVEVAPGWVSGEPPSRERIDINGNGTLTCEVFAIPMPQRIVWYRDGNEITTSTAQVIPQGNKLLFKQVRLNEAGIYQCVAENTHGMVVSSTYVEVVAIAPSFQKRGFGPFYIFSGTRGELECNPEAAPRPSVFKWFKDGNELTGGRYSVHADGTLVINKVDRRRDEGTYECYAENFLGNARASAGATVLQPTKIIRSPRNVTVLEGARVDLICEAEADPSLELRYYWKRDNAEIEYSRKIQWLEDQNVLTIADITVDDAGLYTCVAYTPEPKRSEDSASATVDISGVPDPPLAVELSSDCYNRSTSLKWITGASNNATITHFLIEEKSSYDDDYWRVIAEVTNPNATSYALVNMTGWATLFYRVRAVNRFGPSRPSLPTTSLCRTMQGRPDKWPDNLRGVPGKAEELDIAWKAMPMVEWNAPGLYYILFYGRVGEDFVDTKIADPTVDRFNVNNPGYYIEWQFRIQAGNDVALGDISPIVRAFSGQDPPQGRPENVAVGAVTARTVELSWNPVTVTRGSVDGYRIYYWGESRIQAKRRRRAIPAYATSTNVTGGNTQRHTVTDLKPYYSYNFALKAFNSGGEGPASDEVPANTQEAEPGPPAEVNVYAFAKYILVTWQQPLEPNGIITNYRVGSKQYSGSIPTDEVEMTEVGPEVRRMLLENRTPEEYYVVQIQAKTSIGWGESVRKTTRTVQWSAPAKPARPTVEGIAVDKVRVTYNFGLGGGYTHEFLVMYRKKLAGEQFQNTSWVDHFQVQNIEIGDLSPDLYEFKTVGRNDYPSGGNTESPASDVVEGRPLPGVVNAGKRATTPIHKTAWFIALLVLIAILLLVLLIFVLYTRHQGAKYPVGKREKKRAALIENEPFDEEEGAFANAGRTENPPPYQSEGSLQKGPDSDRDSLDDYGEGPQFNEDGSFIGEYGDEKKGASDEKDPNALATFV